MKKILFVLAGFYPNASANGICADKVMQKLISAGFEVFCVCNQQIGTKSEEIIRGVHVFRIPQLKYLLLYEKSRKKSELIRVCVSKIKKVIEFNRLHLSKRYFPISYKTRFRNYMKTIDALYKQYSIDAIIAINLPFDGVFAATKIKEKHNDIVFIPYFLDPFASSVRHKLIPDSIANKKALIAEKEVLEKANEIIVQNEHKGHFDFCYSNEIKNKIIYLGAPLLTDLHNFNKSIDTNHKYIIYAGVLDKVWRNPQFIFQVFNSIKSLKLVMYVTGDNGWVKKMAEGICNVEVKDPIPHEKLLGIMERASGFLNIGNSQLEAAPSKLFEYMSYCKPIISTYRVDADSSKKYMSQYPCGLLLDERNQDYKVAADIIDNYFLTQKRISFEEIRSIFWTNTPDAVVQCISKHLEN